MIFHFTVSVVALVIVISAGWLLFRQYKRIGRRCRSEKCGRTGVKRVCKILLPPDETVSWRSPRGKRRWFIRRVIKLTFTRCKCGWVELVKIDTDPMSVWHAYWTKRFHAEQYYLADSLLVEAARQKLRKLYLGGRHENLESGASDTPPISLDSLFRDYLEELTEVIAEVMSDK